MAYSEARKQISAIEIALKEQIARPLSSELLAYLGLFIFPVN